LNDAIPCGCTMCAAGSLQDKADSRRAQQDEQKTQQSAKG